MSICGVQLKNKGELEQVLITHHHDAIISAQDFERVQQIKNERAKCPVQKNENDAVVLTENPFKQLRIWCSINRGSGETR